MPNEKILQEHQFAAACKKYKGTQMMTQKPIQKLQE